MILPQKSNEDYEFYFVEKGGYVFAHLNVFNWKLSVYKQLRQEFVDCCRALLLDNHQLLFATSDEEKSVKMWEKLFPLEELKKFGPNDKAFIGAWYLKDVIDGSS